MCRNVVSILNEFDNITAKELNKVKDEVISIKGSVTSSIHKCTSVHNDLSQFHEIVQKIGDHKQLCLIASIKCKLGQKIHPNKKEDKDDDEVMVDWLVNTNIRLPDEISKILRGITSALAYIHDKKYIHRDLKPSNIFCALDNSVKLCDFGLAKIMAKDHVGSLNAGRVAKSHSAEVGTLFNMSPEQRRKHYTNKVDIFALGVIVFEMFHSFDTESESKGA
ncbi:interferon-induced, double-stranded RNA-activated protein kinase-like [Dreissena polymorpha]|uniref:Protein kinase domain-containing protein n=1 Tax=Dreissena polymorpha TaxID=45954 RepID=A0A9D4F9V2_DREPO|nr:interferon-induced, double-stranded RNA-activated protein kinase-like [Dreissena polymorpha]KAH3794905.1 hypothetical protein DPMN_148445 [Dreissena polymorpha]